VRRDPFAAVRRDVLDLCESELPPLDFIDSLGLLLSRALRPDAWAMHAVDPSTFIPVCGRSVGFGSGKLSADALAEIVHEEFLHPGPHSFAGLAASEQTAAALNLLEADPAARGSVRLAHYQRAGISGELRAAFVSHGECWGITTSCRQGGGTFSSHELNFMASISARVGSALRRLVWRESPAQAPRFPPALGVVDHHDAIAEMSAGAQLWLDELKVFDAKRESLLPLVMSIVARQARESAAKSRPGGEIRRVKTLNRGWVSLRGVYLTGRRENPPRVAVIVEPVPRDEIVDFLLTSFRFSSRERQIALLLAQGYDPGEISKRARLSLYTVREHVKNVFEKSDVHSRGELIAKLFVNTPAEWFDGDLEFGNKRRSTLWGPS
jgi:DNA-binding CsgD family transcriptional regulator